MKPWSVLFASTVSTLDGGAERSLLEVAPVLHGRGWRVGLAAWQSGPLTDAFREAGLEVFLRTEDGAQPGRPLGGATDTLPLLREAMKLAVDAWESLRPLGGEVDWLRGVAVDGPFPIIHTNCDLSVPVASRAAKSSGARHVAHIRDHWRRWDLPRVSDALSAAALTIVASENMAERFRPSGLSPRVLPNPVSGRILARDLGMGERERLREGLEVPPGSIALAFVGRLDEQKQPEVAIKTVQTLSQEHPRVVLLLAGNGNHPRRQALEALAGDEVRSGRIRLLGPRTDVEEWLPAMDMLLVPSRGEPFGRMLVEGMLAGLPVVAFDDGAAPEIIRHEDTGFLIPGGTQEAFAEGVRTLLIHPEMAHRLGERAREEALARFDPSEIAKTLEGFYLELLDDGHAPRT